VEQRIPRGRRSPRQRYRGQDRLSELDDYRAVQRYIDVEIVRLEPRLKDPQGKLAAVRRFNAALGDPQRSQPSIQVAGSAGKGSVCQLLSHALQAAGLATGLHTSPYLQSFSEKTQLRGRYATPAQLTAALERVRPVAEAFRHEDSCPASVHGLTSLATSYAAFEAADLEVVVMETGCGGRFDLVQGLDKALCLITDLALDHEHALGPGIERIAWHKAGILEPGVPAAALKGQAFDVLEREAQELGVELHAVVPEEVFLGPDELTLPYLGRIALPLAPRGFARRNLALAAVGLDLLARAGWSLRAEHLAQASAARAMPGRLERVSPQVVLDAAHNPHELAAALAASGSPQGVLLALSGSRDPTSMLAPLAALAKPPWVVVTTLSLYGKQVVPAADLVAAARSLGLEAEALESPERALDACLARGGEVLVTGSVFLVGRLRDRWYPTDEVILQGTSWPK
jgi:dihydrofolate synthase/folylpolyglutamate synthase